MGILFRPYMIITVLLVKLGLAFIERIGLYAEDRR
jgi:hypothetical protein|tara:strand:+ start:575 stop:679 length:105 start_codon:yes stop_codon:yes gene_type:complete